MVSTGPQDFCNTTSLWTRWSDQADILGDQSMMFQVSYDV